MKKTRPSHPSTLPLSASFHKTITLSILIALIFTFAMGILWNDKVRSNYEAPYRYYIHRGSPVTYFGVTTLQSPTLWYIVKIPFSTEMLEDDSNWVKIVDLQYFFTAFFVYLLPGFIIAQTLVWFDRTKSQFKKVTWTLIMLLIFVIVTCFSNVV